MEHTGKSFSDFFFLVPRATRDDEHAKSLDYKDFPKTMIYVRTRAEARRGARHILRNLLPSHLRKAVYVFTGLHSNKYEEKVVEWFRKGSICWLICTDAAAMSAIYPMLSG